MNDVVRFPGEYSGPSLPNAVEAEQSLLGTVLMDNRAYHRVSGFLRDHHFGVEEHQEIYRACGHMIEQGLRADASTLWTHFKANGILSELGGASYLSRLIADYSMRVSDAESYGRLIWDAWAKRGLIQICRECSEAAASGDWSLTAGELANRLSSVVGEITNDGGVTGIRSRREVMQSVVDAMKEPPRVYSTGLRSLDRAMGGGLIAGRCYGLGARKKSGKTTLSGTISLNLNAQDVPHLYICLEMSGEEIEHRNMARAMGESSLRFLQRQETPFLERAASVALRDKASSYYLDGHSMTFENLKGALSLAVSRYGIKGFFLDYLQLMRGKPTKQSTAEFYDDVAQWLANFCRQEKIWGVVPFQLNQTDNVRGGEGPMMAFDQVYFLCRGGDEESPTGDAWLEQRATRYTRYCDVGSPDRPAFYLNEKGPYFEEIA